MKIAFLTEYKKIIIQSLITSFGLDFLVHDEYGGDINTIHNVREVRKDYINREEYAKTSYHSDSRYCQIIQKAESEEEMNNLLLLPYIEFNMRISWKGDFDDFMKNKSNRLVFK